MSSMIECNRISSIENKSGNNDNYALWTNTTGSGIQINEGDEVSVHSAYINEVGVNSDTIEFTGKDINNKNTYFDNKATIKIQFYKSGDGENLLQLPRNFLDDSTYTGTITSGLGMPQKYQDRVSSIGPLIDQSAGVLYENNTDHHYHSKLFFMNYFNQRLTIMTCERYEENSTGTALVYPFVNLRCTEAEFNNVATHERCPCYLKYEVFEKEINLELPKGYLTPSNIVSNITKKLRQKDNEYLLANLAWTFVASPESFTSVQLEPRQKMSSFNTYHPFACSTYASYSHFTAGEMYHETDNAYTNNLNSEFSQLYLSSYKSIAIFDPETYQAGIKLNELSGTFDFSHITYTAVSSNDLGNSIMVTNINFTESNLQVFLNFFNAQALNPLYNDKDLFVGCRNFRYLHFQSDVQHAAHPDKFGSDYNPAYYSKVQYFIWEEQHKNKPPNSNQQYPEDYIYGIFTNFNGKIALPYTTIYCGLNTSTDPGVPSAGQYMGFDSHFSAFGTNAFLLYNGLLPYSNAVAESNIRDIRYYVQGTTSQNETCSMCNRVYVGSITPTFNFDSTSSFFNFSELHTPRVLRSPACGGEDNDFPDNLTGTEALLLLATAETTVNPSAGTPIISINPKFFDFLYNPEYYNGRAYNNFDGFFRRGGENYDALYDNETYRNFWNIIFEFNVIFDAQSGIFIKDFGIPKELFLKSLWGRLGFTYDGLSLGSNINRQTRIDEGTLINNPITTNAIVNANTRLNLLSNPYGVAMYVPLTNNYYLTPQLKVSDATAVYDIQHNPSININTSSVFISSTQKPVKMIYPYYLLRSNIILNKNFIGGLDATNLPIVAVCNKAYSGDDYYFIMSDGSFSFVATQNYVISEIKQSLHNPDGTFCSVNDGCSVIYQIRKRSPMPQPPIELPPPPIQKKK